MAAAGEEVYVRKTGSSEVRLCLTGIGPANAKKGLERISPWKPDSVLSIGFAGALQEGIEPGDIVVDSSSGAPEVADAFERAASQSGLAFHRGSFSIADKVLRNSREKEEAGARTGAIAVEMEGGAIFEACRSQGIGFCSVRAVSDSLNQSLPSSISAIGPRGEITGKFIMRVLLRPWEWVDLARLARSSEKAEKNLSKILINYLNRQ